MNNNKKTKMKYLKFEEMLPELRKGKKAKMVDWDDPHYAYIQEIRTQEFEEDNISSQPFVALFYNNGGLMPHPYSFPNYDIMGGQWEIID